MNPEKRQQLRASLNDLIGIRNKNDNKSMTYNKSKNYPKQSRNKEKQLKASRNFGANSYHPVNAQMLSADRLMQQNSFRIDA